MLLMTACSTVVKIHNCVFYGNEEGNPSVKKAIKKTWNFSNTYDKSEFFYVSSMVIFD